jgi:LDH2 family malate/lactate/ureidoglycolate dehydrogenase
MSSTPLRSDLGDPSEDGGAGEWVRLPADELRSATQAVLRRHHATSEEAVRVTDALVDADARGQHSHGIFRLPTICGRVKAGLIQPGAAPEITRAAGGLLAVDGRRGFGHWVAWRVMEETVRVAKETGIALAGVRNNNHIGMVGYYAEAAAARGMILAVMTTSEAMVRPWGGREALLGTNPIGIGVPAAPRPFVLDMSTSATAIGKIMERASRQQSIPVGWAVDPAGNETQDPDDALRGAINPFGGAKGYGLGLAVGLLVGALSGAAPDPEVAGTLDVEFPSNKGDLFIAIDPSFLRDGESLLEWASDYLDRVRTSRPAPGFDAVLIPGDRGSQARDDAQAGGVTVPANAWEKVRLL